MTTSRFIVRLVTPYTNTRVTVVSSLAKASLLARDHGHAGVRTNWQED